MKKNVLAMMLLAAMMLSFAVCGGAASAEAPETITIQSMNAAGELVELEVPYDPQRIAILDLASLDILDNLGLGDRVVGTATTSIEYLATYADNADIANLGNVKTADMEAVMACEPDIIFAGGRLKSVYDELSEIAPTVLLTTDAELGVLESTRRNALTIASIFGLEDAVSEKFDGFGARLDTLKEAAGAQTCVLSMVTGGSFNFLGNDGRLSLIVNEIGFENIGANAAGSGNQGGHGGNGGNGGEGHDHSGSAENHGKDSAVTTPHGEETSFELVTKLNPAYIFVLDRDMAIGTEGAQLAADLLDNELVNDTDAAKNGHVVIFDDPAVWYTAEGGISALEQMITDMEAVLLG